MLIYKYKMLSYWKLLWQILLLLVWQGNECGAPAAPDFYTECCSEASFSVLVQTVILINDLATVLDAQGHYDEAYSYVKRAAELAKETQHPEEHMVLNNLAAILMHKGR